MSIRRRRAGAALAAVVLLGSTATALAAHPKKGAKYQGTLLERTLDGSTAPVVWGKFRAPVSFSVAGTGAKLTGFKYADTGCFGFGGVPTTTDIYSFSSTHIKVGTVAVSASGSFAVKHAKSVFTSSASDSTTTTSSVSGRFTSAKKASGTIVYSQSEVYKVSGKTYHETCGPASVTFSAKS